jgi:rSAM/selenodomain-associated transferase 1
MPEQLKKALLIFAKRPLPGKVKTRLVPPFSPEQAADLYRCMLGDVLAMVTTFSDLALYFFYEDTEGAREYFAGIAPGISSLPQWGKDLGERMAEAFRVVFAKGHGAAVVIGTDAPDLPPDYIKEAFDRLESGKEKAVFGPCDDGGYYLLGITRLNFALFRDIPWSSGTVLEESLKKAAEAGIEVSILPKWHDVDTAADLERPELLDEDNDAPRTRKFIANWRRRCSKPM